MAQAHKPVTLETRTTTVTIAPPGEPATYESAIIVEIDDEGAGEYVRIQNADGQGSFTVDPECWPAVRRAINRLIRDCRGPASDHHTT